MSRLEQTTKRLGACWGAVIVLCLPAFAETPIPDRERMDVGDLILGIRHSYRCEQPGEIRRPLQNPGGDIQPDRT